MKSEAVGKEKRHFPREKFSLSASPSNNFLCTASADGDALKGSLRRESNLSPPNSSEIVFRGRQLDIYS